MGKYCLQFVGLATHLLQCGGTHIRRSRVKNKCICENDLTTKPFLCGDEALACCVNEISYVLGSNTRAMWMLQTTCVEAVC